MQEAGDLEFVAVLLGHPEILERTLSGIGDRIGQHHGQGRHTLAMTAGIGRLFIDRRIHDVDERFEQLFQLQNEIAVGQGNGGLRSQALGQALVGIGKFGDLAGQRLDPVEQLQHPDDLVLVIAHRNGEEGGRAIPGFLVKISCAGKVETVGRISIRDIHRIAGQRRIGGDHRSVGLVDFVIQLDRIKGNRIAAGSAKRDLKRIVEHDFELQSFPVDQAIQGATVGIGNTFGGKQDLFEQGIDITLLR